MATLTVKALQALTGADDGRRLPDRDGLNGRVRVRKNGTISVTFELRFKREGRTTAVACGTWPKVDLADIRKKAREHRQTLAAGTTPKQQRDDAELARQAERVRHERIVAEEKARVERERLDGLTVRDLYTEWLPTVSVKRGKRGRKDGGAEIVRTFDLFVLPRIGGKPLTQVFASDVRPVLTGISDTGRNRQATALLTDLKQMFRWGDQNQPWKRLLASSDVLAIRPEEVVSGSYDPVRDNERDRVLSEPELRALARLLPDAGLSSATQSAIWLMLACGTRVGETVAARWAHVDLERRVWRIPAENTKSEIALTVHLSDFAHTVLATLWTAREALPEERRSEWVFPSRNDRTMPLNNQTVGKALADRQKPGGEAIAGRTQRLDALLLEGGQWKCHDLRRTCGTLMQSLGVAESIVHRCLNHARSDKLDRVYLQHDYSSEMREAWRLLGERLDLLTRADADKVVVLKLA